MKKMIFAASLLVSGYVFATATEITNDCVIGVLPISASGKQQVILSVPWVEIGGVTNVVSVSNLVKTSSFTYDARMPDATMLGVYDSEHGDYKYWNLEQGADDVGYWNAAREGISSDVPFIHRGESIILTRTNTLDSAKTIYIIGQVGNTSAVTNTIAAATYNGVKTIPTYTLLAPPNASTTVNRLNDGLFSVAEGVINEKDEIITGAESGFQGSMIRKNNQWVFSYLQDDLDNGPAKALVPAGRGFYYKRCATTPLKITWNAPSVSAE